MHILVVEDNLIAQKVAEMILSSLGCKVTIAANGEQAIANFSSNSYQLIFMDLGLPDINGVEITRAIRKLEQNLRAVPIVGLTANYNAEEKKIALEAGMNDFFPKPLTKEQAELILNKFVKPTL